MGGWEGGWVGGWVGRRVDTWVGGWVGGWVVSRYAYFMTKFLCTQEISVRPYRNMPPQKEENLCAPKGEALGMSLHGRSGHLAALHVHGDEKDLIAPAQSINQLKSRNPLDQSSNQQIKHLVTNKPRKMANNGVHRH